MRSAEQLAAMSCPVCRVPLAMSDRQGIEIDYCPQCRGVWLDRGELDKIIERSLAQVPPAPQQAPTQQPPAPQPFQQSYGQKPWDGQPHYRHKKRKSWLEEIFD
jgi:Zn-finger nucleic acid-binding protein